HLTNKTARTLAPQPRNRTRGFEVEHLPAGAEADAIAIVDPGGYLVYFERMQDAHLGSVQFAVDKARSAVLFRRPTKVCEDALAGGRTAILALHGAVPIEGGVLIICGGKIAGAIGASGGTAQQEYRKS